MESHQVNKRGPKPKNYAGFVFGRLTVIRFSHKKESHRYWIVRCECGIEKVMRQQAFVGGASVSCGCYQKEIAEKICKQRTKHGKYGSPTYMTWRSMLSRCYFPSQDSYKYYGGKGIVVCDRWHKFENFLSDMGERPDEKTIDRINNNLGYFKENCKWSNGHQQRMNQARIQK